MCGADACSKLAAGADLVQIYTGLIYKGPGLAQEVAAALKRAADRRAAGRFGAADPLAAGRLFALRQTARRSAG